MWVGLYDATPKKGKQSWIGNVPREGNTSSIEPRIALPFEWGYAVSIDFFTNNSGDNYAAVLILKEATKEIITYEPLEYNTAISPFSDNIIVPHPPYGSTDGSVNIDTGELNMN